MKTPVLMFACALGLAAPAARAQEYVYMLSSGELRGMIDQGNPKMAIAYISGVMDTMMRNRDFCVPPGVNAGEIGAKAYRIIARQPRESKAPAADVIAVFLHSDYPCTK